MKVPSNLAGMHRFIGTFGCSSGYPGNLLSVCGLLAETRDPAARSRPFRSSGEVRCGGYFLARLLGTSAT